MNKRDIGELGARRGQAAELRDRQYFDAPNRARSLAYDEAMEAYAEGRNPFGARRWPTVNIGQSLEMNWRTCCHAGAGGGPIILSGDYERGRI